MDNGFAQALGFVADLKDKVHSASEVVIDGRQYTRGALHAVRNPEVPKIELHTLVGVVDYLDANVDGLDLPSCMVHVVSPSVVQVLTSAEGPFKQRTTVVESTAILNEFPFGKFMPSEAFIIGVNALFVDDDNKTELLKSVAAIKIDTGGKVQDNGISQTVTVEAGSRLLTDKAIKPKVTLRPFCSFVEIEQPSREFIFRLNAEGQPGLFVADGYAWRNKAMADIKEWFAKSLPKEVHIIA